MSAIPRIDGGLQIEQDPQFQRLEWRIQRVAWGLALLVIAAALAGLFGSGPLAKAEARAGTASVTYPRFARLLAPVRAEITLPVRNGEAWMAIDNEYLASMEIATIAPQAREQEGSPGETRLVFDGTGTELHVHVEMTAERAGLLTARVRTEPGALTIRQFIYP